MQFKWRNHDPAIGRFFNIDPLAHKYVYNSPYAFSENDVISAIELEGLEKVRITNYSKIQSHKISENLKAKNSVLNTPITETEGRRTKLAKINNSNSKIMDIIEYGSNNGFPNNYMTNKLEENGIEVPGAVKDGEKTTTTEVIDPKAEPSIELYGVSETENGALEMGLLGEINPSKEAKTINEETAKAVGKKLVETVIDFLLTKKAPLEFPPVIVPEEKEMQ